LSTQQILQRNAYVQTVNEWGESKNGHDFYRFLGSAFCNAAKKSVIKQGA
jgi:hypothetical protein